MSTQQEIARVLLEINAVGFALQNPIRFKSGILSPVYVDNRKLPFYTSRWSKVFEGFQQIIEDGLVSFDIVSGVESAGIPHSAALGFVLKRPSVFVRKTLKDHGTKKMVEGGDVTGKHVLLIEDHVTTGGSSLKAVQALRDAGAVVTDCLSITSYEFAEAKQAFREARVQLHTLTTFAHILKEAKKMKKISTKDITIVKDWIKDSFGWGVQYGFEEVPTER